MSHQAWSLRAAIAAHHPERGKPYDPELKERILSHVASRRAAGASLASLAVKLGMSTETLRVWSGAGARRGSRAMIPVQVVAERHERGATVVSASGHRIEGLTLEEAISVLRALG